MKAEKWKKLYNFREYEISNTGVIRSIPRQMKLKDGTYRNYPGKVISKRKNKKNPHFYSSVSSTLPDGTTLRNKTVYVHRAVADHFLPKRPSLKGKVIYAHHINGDHTNNHVSNLMWISSPELISKYQPQRLADPTKSWRTRREKYGNSTGSAETPKWNPKKIWETRRKNKSNLK